MGVGILDCAKSPRGLGSNPSTKFGGFPEIFHFFPALVELLLHTPYVYSLCYLMGWRLRAFVDTHTHTQTSTRTRVCVCGCACTCVCVCVWHVRGRVRICVCASNLHRGYALAMAVMRTKEHRV